jgi:hypothetical protein
VASSRSKSLVWEYAFPHTPTTFALRGDRYTYIFYHGVSAVSLRLTHRG